MRTLLTLFAIAGVMLAVNGAALGIVIDGSIADWNSKYIYTDASGDGPAEFQLENWGFFYQSFTASDPGYLYAFIEASRPFAEYNSGANDAWPGLWVDVDHYSGPATREWGCYRATSPTGSGGPDYGQVYKGPSAGNLNSGWCPSEWQTGKHQGIDVVAELGINTAHWGEGWNYWGWADVLGTQGTAVGGTGSQYATGGNYLEMQIDIRDMVAEAKRYADYTNGNYRHGGKINGLWKIGARGEANVTGGGTFGVDATNVVWVPIIADADGDGNVDIDDFSKLAVNYNKTGLSRPWEVTGYESSNAITASWEQGDFDLDGAVDLDDFAFLAVTFNADMGTLGPPSGGAVPEPVTLALLGLGGLLLRRRR